MLPFYICYIEGTAGYYGVDSVHSEAKQTSVVQ